MTRIPRLVIAGTHSGVGKTTIATALMAAFARRGLRVQPFKIGPDFIDPGFHAAASGRKCYNLDGWMLPKAANGETFERGCRDADLAVVEGVMGLFDGRDAAGESGSTAEMAKWLGAPVLLVVDASAMARSAAAVVRGFETFDSAVNLSGVIFNRTGGQRHAEMLRTAVAGACRATPLGALPRNEKIGLPSRHLGLTPAAESLSAALLDEMVAWVEAHLDLEALLTVARAATGFEGAEVPGMRRAVARRVRVGLARDAAFCFYYQDNLDLLEEAGAELVEFSPIRDGELPRDIRGLYLGGGYPELHAGRLAENRAMREAVRRFAASGFPVYAECGGFMYLTEAIVDAEGVEHAMTGVFPTRARMQRRLAALGYVEAEAAADTLWLRAGDRLRGHEFRYSAIDEMPAEGVRRLPFGSYQKDAVMGGYTHLHFRSCPEFAARFVDACETYRNHA